MGRCVNDLVMIGFAYLIICVSYSCGIIFSLKVNRDTHPHSYNTTQTEELTFNATFKTLFWNIVDTGRKPKQIPNEGVLGKFIYIMYFIYNVLIVVVLLNLLIAIMNSTVQRLEDKRQLYWKYNRTSIWIEHFDDTMALPLPYSCFHIFKALVKLFKKIDSSAEKDNCDHADTNDFDEKRFNYVRVIKELSKRITETEGERKNETKINCPSSTSASGTNPTEANQKNSFVLQPAVQI